MADKGGGEAVVGKACGTSKVDTLEVAMGGHGGRGACEEVGGMVDKVYTAESAASSAGTMTRS